MGGGGLILLPALFTVFPTTMPATLFGTNKAAWVWGTATAAAQYAKRVDMRWKTLLPAVGAGFADSLAGAWLVTMVSSGYLRQALPFVLAAALIYTLSKKDMGHTHAPRFSGHTETAVACCIGLTLGFYDGFFGPGTGSFFVFLFVRWLGYDF